jgi:purine nucleosidase
MSHWPSQGTRDSTPLHPNRPVWGPPRPAGEPAKRARNDNAALVRIRIADKYPHKFTIRAAGPLTDIALAASVDPQFAALAKQPVFIGGSFNAQLADTPIAHPSDCVNTLWHEFKIRFAPEAAAIALQRHRQKISKGPVDATQGTTLMSHEMRREAAHGKVSFDHGLGLCQVYPHWDETPVALWLDPAPTTRDNTLLVRVDTNFAANFGTIKRSPLGTGSDSGGQPVHVVSGVDAANIGKPIVRLLTAPKPMAEPFQRNRLH